jgi:conjugative relaxase-like TrwC/TraI family protein
MLSIAEMSGGQGHYYTGLAREDYYLEGGEPPGLWAGSGAVALGMKGQVDKEVLGRVFDGFDARGVPLVQNAGNAKRQAGWDLTFSAPKSVSVLWSLLPKDLGQQIRQAHEEAVKVACAYIEDQAGWTRRGKAGKLREKAGLLFALFEHGTSRAGDPQLHTHALCLNLCVRADGTTGSIWSQNIYDHKMAAGAVYRAELAHQLQKRLGLEVRKVRSWFEIVGVDSKLMDHWSKRRKEIEASLLELGYSGPRAAEAAALATRDHKLHVPRERLFEQWREIGEEKGWGRDAAIALCRHVGLAAQRLLPDPLRKQILLNEAVDALTSQQAYFSSVELVRKISELAQGRGVGGREVLDVAKQFLEKQAISLGEHKGQELFTTREMLKLEKQILERVNASQNAIRHLVPEVFAKTVLKLFPQLNEQQQNAVHHVTGGRGDVVAISGMAGTGKTTMLKAAAYVWRSRGLKVIGASLAGKAADGLENEAGIKSSTLAKLLYMAQQSRNPLKDFENPLDARTVVVIDEASMIGTRGMAQLLDEAARAKAKVVLVGDARQLQPIEAGGPFASICKRIGCAELTTIVRQKEEWARQAVHHMADGHAMNALSAFAERGQLTVSKTRTEAYSDLLNAWKVGGVKAPEKNLILACTNTEIEHLNKEAQALRAARNQLGRLHLTVQGQDFHKNDRILFTKNSAVRGVKNGQLGTVLQVDPLSRSLLVKLDNGRKVLIPTLVYNKIQLGYAVTTHKAQGMTTRNAFVLTHPSMQDKEMAYVQASRSSNVTHLFTTRVEAGSTLTELARTMSRSRQKGLAADLIGRAEDVGDVLKEHQQKQSMGQRLAQELKLTR